MTSIHFLKSKLKYLLFLYGIYSVKKFGITTAKFTALLGTLIAILVRKNYPILVGLALTLGIRYAYGNGDFRRVKLSGKFGIGFTNFHLKGKNAVTVYYPVDQDEVKKHRIIIQPDCKQWLDYASNDTFIKAAILANSWRYNTKK